LKIYLGRKFTVRTDALGMKFIFERKGPKEDSLRVVRRAEGFALRVCNYDFDMEHIGGDKNIADAPSRLVFDDSEAKYPGEIGHELDNGDWPSVVAHIEDDNENDYDIGYVTLNELKVESQRDPIIKLLKKQLEKKSDEKWPQEILWYRQRRDEMRIVGDLLIIENRILVPETLQDRLLEIAHRGHPKASTMMGALKERVWWLYMKRDIDKVVSECELCKLTQKTENPIPMRMSTLPTEVWSHVAVDFFGPLKNFGNIYIMVIADYFSRFLVTKVVKSTSAEKVIPVLSEVFKFYGHPEVLRSDNGPPFVSRAFTKFLRQRGIEVEHSTPLHPQQNGLVERYMQILKQVAEIAKSQVEFLQMLENRISMHNRARNRMTNRVPRDLMFGRKLRDEIPFIGATTDMDLEDYQEMRERDSEIKSRRKELEDAKRHAKPIDIQEGDVVLVERERKKKTETPLMPGEAIVEEVRGGDLTLRLAGGKKLDRNIIKVKRIIPSKIQLSEEERLQQADEIIENSGAHLREDERVETPTQIRRSERIKEKKKKFFEVNMLLREEKERLIDETDWLECEDKQQNIRRLEKLFRELSEDLCKEY
jgi:transposase InsO family protein